MSEPAVRPPRVSLIVAMAENRVIGVSNRLPWHLPADLRRFRAVTWGKPILMGRKTHASIGRALPGRTNLILTRDTDYAAPGCIIVPDVEAALARCGIAPEVMVIGGAAVYGATLPLATRLYLTTIHRDYEGDVLFPPIDLSDWCLVSREQFQRDDALGAGYSFELFERPPPKSCAQGSGPAGD